MNYGNSAGIFTFGTQWTRGPFDNSAAAPHGQALASFLLGLPTAGGFDVKRPGHPVGLLRVLHPGRLARDVGADVEPRSALRARSRHDREEQWAGRLRPGPVEQRDRAARSAYAANPRRAAAHAFNPTGGLIFASPDRRQVTTPRATRSRPASGSPGRLRSCATTRCSAAGSASSITPTAPPASSSLASARRRRSCHPRWIPDAGCDVVQSVPCRHPAAGDDRARCRSEPRSGGDVLQPRHAAQLLPALYGGRAAAPAGGDGGGAHLSDNQARGLPINDDLNFVPANSSARRPTRSGDHQSPDRERRQSVRRVCCPGRR